MLGSLSMSNQYIINCMCHKANMLFNNKENASSSNPYEWMNKNKAMIIEWITANIMKCIYLAVRS